jgi:hypothetical protein
MRSPATRSQLLFAAISIALLRASACVDIQDAKYDPTLEQQGATTAAGAGGGDASSASDAASSDAGSDSGADICARYCQTVMAGCTGANAVYADPQICASTCDALPLGTDGDELGNTVYCRLRNAELAPAEPETYCPIAGPGGNGVCGSNCEGYCTLMQQICPSMFTSTFATLTGCKTQCDASIPDLGGYSIAIKSGDSLQCRLYHLGAATLDPGLHCPHAAGESPCN